MPGSTHSRPEGKDAEMKRCTGLCLNFYLNRTELNGSLLFFLLL